MASKTESLSTAKRNENQSNQSAKTWELKLATQRKQASKSPSRSCKACTDVGCGG